ncbi:MAG: hypothetical protein QM504_10415 [Pseudomonadota bacterium]
MTTVGKKRQYRKFDRRVTFWVGEEHQKLIDRACETVGINRSEMARRLFLDLAMPKEDLMKNWNCEFGGYSKYPPKKAV